ncbi:metallophosphoesterase family protein [Achromobacter xylosoxidans]|uniref:metallophosphoesterase family protein n=2 Tax=Alcaligenes xylosoxydans xylosoxydans TaxID=85698 RepID=UPI0005F96A43|nr:DNA repair exonuclease [Achromobacter xylosoxidans]AUZ20499.1 DNA repair exonuclease [Achromobacter xylosoxidans]MCZ8386912.1 DNA repair exonuclease [Achromobacter xylosoxidans]MCZ8439381.1 DNA repair exonuclease [Achromobacter xylosoxidans]OFL36355.1 metallophosphatase [Achromobacter xylosoxidans]OMG79063.1 metallophosphatase [Achromobacter xylosoxidans]
MTHFLHTADWQIGRQYGQFETDDAALLAEARFDAVARIAALAAERQVDAVLVAGDVFDTQGVSDRTIRRLFAALAAYAGPWVMIAGNHDAALADSVWSRAAQLGCIPPNVRVPPRPGVVDLAAQNLAVLAAPLTQRHTYDDVTQAFDAMESEPGRIRVGLAHGSVAGRLPDTIDATNPIAPDRASRARLDYLALGDWHGCLSIDERTWYAGTPEQDRFRGNEPGYVLDVRIAAPGATPQVERVATGKYRWSAWTETLSLPTDAQALAERLAALRAEDVLRLELQGHVNVPTWEALQRAVDQAAAQARAVLPDFSGLLLEPDDADLAQLGASGYVGEVATQLQAMQADPEQAAVAGEALRLLLRFQREGAAAGGAQ